jgi:hypothetical protein
MSPDPSWPPKAPDVRVGKVIEVAGALKACIEPNLLKSEPSETTTLRSVEMLKKVFRITMVIYLKK